MALLPPLTLAVASGTTSEDLSCLQAPRRQEAGHVGEAHVIHPPQVILQHAAVRHVLRTRRVVLDGLGDAYDVQNGVDRRIIA